MIRIDLGDIGDYIYCFSQKLVNEFDEKYIKDNPIILELFVKDSLMAQVEVDISELINRQKWLNYCKNYYIFPNQNDLDILYLLCQVSNAFFNPNRFSYTVVKTTTYGINSSLPLNETQDLIWVLNVETSEDTQVINALRENTNFWDSAFDKIVTRDSTEEYHFKVPYKGTIQEVTKIRERAKLKEFENE